MSKITYADRADAVAVADSPSRWSAAEANEVKTTVNANDDESISLRTLSGTTAGDDDLGTFTGATIADNVDVKVALQALETASEASGGEATSLRTLSGTTAGDNNLGTFTGTTIADNVTMKAAIQSLETGLEALVRNGFTKLGSITADPAPAAEGLYTADASAAAFDFTLPAATGSQAQIAILGADVETNAVTVKVPVGESLDDVVDGTYSLALNGQTLLALDRGVGLWDIMVWGEVPNTSPLPDLADAKGDIFVGSGNNAIDRLPVGADGQVQIADSTEPLGIRWGAVTAGVTELNPVGRLELTHDTINSSGLVTSIDNLTFNISANGAAVIPFTKSKLTIGSMAATLSTGANWVDNDPVSQSVTSNTSGSLTVPLAGQYRIRYHLPNIEDSTIGANDRFSSALAVNGDIVEVFDIVEHIGTNGVSDETGSTILDLQANDRVQVCYIVEGADVEAGDAIGILTPSDMANLPGATTPDIIYGWLEVEKIIETTAVPAGSVVPSPIKSQKGSFEGWDVGLTNPTLTVSGDIASAAAVGSGTAGDVAVLFDTPFDDADYVLQYTIIGSANAANDDDVRGIHIRDKTANGFTIHAEEVSPVVQGYKVEVMAFSEFPGASVVDPGTVVPTPLVRYASSRQYNTTGAQGVNTSDLTFAGSAVVDLSLGTEQIAPGSNFSIASNVITVNQAGLYKISAIATGNDPGGASNRGRLHLGVNAVGVASSESSYNVGFSDSHVINYLAQLDVSDTVQFRFGTDLGQQVDLAGWSFSLEQQPESTVVNTSTSQYSALEQVTDRTWIDGKPIYERYFDISAAANGATLLTGVDVLVEQFGSITGDAVSYLPASNTDTSSVARSVLNAGTNVVTIQRLGAFATPRTGEFFVLRYTKV